MMVGIGAHVLERQALEAIRDLGIDHVRHTIYWNRWAEPEYRRYIGRLLERTRHLDLLLVLHGGHGPDREFIRFAADVARLAPTSALQIWNEPDALFPGSERFEGSPDRYASHLRAVYDRLKRVAPEVTVVTAGLATNGDSLKRWAAAAAPHADVVATHVYGFPMVAAFREKAALVRQVTDQRLWCTELGMERAVIPPDWPPHDWEELQLEKLRECLLEDSLPYERAYVHVLQDGIPEGHGLYRPDWSPRPAAVWLARWRR